MDYGNEPYPADYSAIPQDPYNLQPGMQDPSYDYDTIEAYGGIIKDLTDTEKILDDYELKLRGKKRKEDGSIIVDKSQRAMVKTDMAARDLVNLARSVVNRHNDFSYFELKESQAVLHGFVRTVNRWLMFQCDEVPLGYRQKISFELTSFVFASLHKATDGRMLKWTKGTFREGTNITDRPERKKSLMDYIPGFGKKGR